MKDKKREMFLDILPTFMYHSRKCIDWKKSVGYTVKFIYEDIEGEIGIIGYDIKSQSLKLIYEGREYNMLTNGFSKCQLGKILNKITKNFKVDIGQYFKDDKRDIIITDREYRIRIDNEGYKNNNKWYKYKCNKCENEDWIVESHLLISKLGCNICCTSPNQVKLGYNTIWDTDRWMCDMGVSKEDSKKYSKSSGKKITIICPYCGKTKRMTPNTLYGQHSIGCSCSYKNSYPEKIMYSILKQLDEKFDTQYYPNWCKFIDYNNKDKVRRGYYDFKLENNSFIIETDGGWHKKNNNLSGQTKEESKYIDDEKDRLALENGYDVIRIDCEKSNLEFIKQNIIDSKLNELYDLSKIDWNKCEEFASSNLVKIACDYKKNSPDMSINDICVIVGKSIAVVREYLKKGAKLGWCDYDPKEEIEKSSRLQGVANRRQVSIFKNGNKLGIFPSCAELSRQSEKLFGVKLHANNISRNCRDNKTYKGFTFMYS